MRAIEGAAKLAAVFVHAYRAELARLNPPQEQARGTVAAATQVNTGVPARGSRTGQTSPVTALDGVGFTATRKAADDQPA